MIESLTTQERALTPYDTVRAALRTAPRTWLVTGVAGFIGSHLLETLLKLDQRVVGLDNFATGYRHNLTYVRDAVKQTQWRNFRFIEGDISSLQDCRAACAGVKLVLHQAALGSVPRSIEEPILSNGANVTGFLNMLVAARDAAVKRFVYASSSSVYGDHPALPKKEEEIGEPLSPYALTKRINEKYASVFARCYGFAAIGLRYFNIFGPRQDPQGTYAAVIPRWIAAMIHDEPVFINGDGETSRDFCYVANAVQANLLAAMATDPAALGRTYNVAMHNRTTLNRLFESMRGSLATRFVHLRECKPVYRDSRPGDVRHSLADIGKAAELLGYRPTHTVEEGLREAMDWYVTQLTLKNCDVQSKSIG